MSFFNFGYLSINFTMLILKTIIPLLTLEFFIIVMYLSFPLNHLQRRLSIRKTSHVFTSYVFPCYYYRYCIFLFFHFISFFLDLVIFICFNFHCWVFTFHKFLLHVFFALFYFLLTLPRFLSFNQNKTQ